MPLYDEIEIEDMIYDPVKKNYTYPCPCGDVFRIALFDLWDGEDEAGCESCTLYIEVIYDEEDLPPLPEDDDDDDDESVEQAIVKENRADKNEEADLNQGMKKLSVSSQWIDR